MLKFKRAYTGGPLFGGDGAEAIALGIALLAQVKKRPQTPKPPTPAQIAAGERSDWNAEVARRKAEKQQKKEVSMALSDKKIDAVTLLQWGEMKGHPLAAHRAYARAIEAEVQKQDEALIRLMLTALEHHTQQTRPIARTDDAIAAAFLRLNGKP